MSKSGTSGTEAVSAGAGSGSGTGSGSSKPPPASRASSPISAIDISSGSSSTTSSSASSGSSNIERSGIPASSALSATTGLRRADISGASKLGTGSASPDLSDFVAEGLTRAVKSERSSSALEISGSASITGIPRTNSSESFISSMSFGISIFTGFSPRAARRFISSPSERISLLNCLS